MRNIQILLLSMFLVGTAIYFTRMRSRLVDRIFVMVFVLAGVVMVSFPRTGDWLAEALGVGRGADAVIYSMLVFLSYFCLQLFSKLRIYEARLVELSRSIAIQNAKLPEIAEETVPEILPIADARRLRDPRWSVRADEAEVPLVEPYARAG